MRRALSLSVALLGACSSDSERVMSGASSVYGVFELTPKRGRSSKRSGPVRVAIIEVVPADRNATIALGEEQFGSSCGTNMACAQAAEQRGALYMRSAGYVAGLPRKALLSMKVGERQTLAAPSLSFRSFHREDSPLELVAEEPGGAAEVEATLVKACPAVVRRVTRDGTKMGGSGVIAVPGSYTHHWWELTRPSCFDPSDLAGELWTDEERAARARAEAEAKAAIDANTARFAAEQAEKRAASVRYRDARYASMQERAKAWAAAHPAPESQPSSVEAAIGPEATGLMIAAGIAELAVEYKCTNGAATCKRMGHVMTVSYVLGDRAMIGAAHRPTERLYGLFRRVWIEGETLRVTLGEEAERDPGGAIAAVRETIDWVAKNTRSGNDPDRTPMPQLPP